MTVHSARVGVTDEPTNVCVTEDGSLIPGGKILVTNRSVANLDWGGADVVSGEGFQLDAGDTLAVELKDDEELFIVGPAAGPFIVHVGRTGVVQ